MSGRSRPRFDWSAPLLLPLEMERGESGLRLAAGGRSVTFEGLVVALESDDPVEADLREQIGELATLQLDAQATRKTFLREVAWLQGQWRGVSERVVAATALQDIALFLRSGDVSFFCSLDFPYSRISDAGISYPANSELSPQSSLGCHSLSIGACRLSGDLVGRFDRAEIEAFSAYVERRFPQRFNYPLVISSSITNRYADCRDGRIFYTMRDNPTLALNPQLASRDIELLGEIGGGYYQLFEGSFDWPDEERCGTALRELVRIGEKRRVRIGDYINPQGLYCPHFNYCGRDVGRPEWLQVRADGSAGSYCLGCAEYVGSFADRLVEQSQRYQLWLTCFDFLDIQPCYATNHGHPMGDVYQQVRALVRLFERLGELQDGYLVWSNSGNWIELMPKLVWWNPSVYLTDPHLRRYAPTLNMLKLLGDGRREQMVTVHNSHFVPYRAFTNCEYYAFPRSRVHDIHVFEYSLLQGLAVTPNVAPCELRSFLDRIPGGHRERCIEFMRRWTMFVSDHFDVWQATQQVGDDPGLGAAEIYAHVKGDRGYICLVNQNPFPRVASFVLDGSIGLSEGDVWYLSEVYPRECAIGEQPLPHARRSERITVELEPCSVRIIEVTPRPGCDLPRVTGLPGRIYASGSGYRAHLVGAQGLMARVGIELPSGRRLTGVRVRQVPTVPVYTFGASARIAEQNANLAWVEVTFPRERAPRALTRWRVSPGEVEANLPQIGSCPFLGALVWGALSEEYEVLLDLTASEDEGVEGARLEAPPPPPAPAEGPVPWAPRQAFTTEFVLPFIEPAWLGAMPGYDDDALIELAFAEPDAVASVSARLNGTEVEVLTYRYPQRPQWRSHYIELTGQVEAGTVRLEVELEWASVVNARCDSPA